MYIIVSKYGMPANYTHVRALLHHDRREALLARLARPARLPCTQHQIHNVFQSLFLLDHREDGRSALPHPSAVSLHDPQVCAYGLGQVAFVHDQKIALRDARPALARDLVAARNVDNVDDEVGQLARVVRRKVVPAGLNQQQISVKLVVQLRECKEVRGDVFTDGGMGAAARLNGDDTLGGQGVVLGEELAVFAGEDVVCDGGDGEARAEGFAEGKHEGGLAGAYGA